MKKNIFIFLAGVLLLGGCLPFAQGRHNAPVSAAVYDDDVITANIMAAYSQEDGKKISNIYPASYQGHLYLVGEYATMAQKNRAIEIARTTLGVRSLTFYLLPERTPPFCSTMENLEIQTRVNASLINDSALRSANIDVRTVQCNAVLLGVVASEQEAEASLFLAQNVAGVRDVQSYLRVQ